MKFRSSLDMTQFIVRFFFVIILNPLSYSLTHIQTHTHARIYLSAASESEHVLKAAGNNFAILFSITSRGALLPRA